MSANQNTTWFSQLLAQRSAEDRLKQNILSYHKNVAKSCRDRFALQDARELIPIAELVQDNLDILEGDNYLDDLLPILTRWFANEFFSWFTAPDCEQCHGPLIAHRTGINPEGLSLETYKCSKSCDYTYDFIRHNDPAILLHTRKGRCGEWANCFLLILRAMDYDARLVLDTTDHVWNEVWSEPRQRWIHVDPCEAVVDCPLLYELGWAKKLEYCIAFSQYETIDVTRRYTRDMDAIRRTRSNKEGSNNDQHEQWLTKYLDDLTMQALAGADVPTKGIVIKRRLLDMKHLDEIERNGPPDVDVTKLGGRKTGSIAWRIERGEYSPIIKNLHVIKVEQQSSSDPEIFSIHYDCDKNSYISSNKDLNVNGWHRLIYEAENVDHKFERDWKTSYLARYECCPPNLVGKVHWRFDMSSIKEWARIEVSISAKSWPDTDLKAKLEVSTDGDKLVEQELKLNETNLLKPDDFGMILLSRIDLIISLSGGKPEDSVAWQKPQLFRQVRGQTTKSPFMFKIYTQPN